MIEWIALASIILNITQFFLSRSQKSFESSNQLEELGRERRNIESEYSRLNGREIDLIGDFIRKIVDLKKDEENKTHTDQERIEHLSALKEWSLSELKQLEKRIEQRREIEDAEVELPDTDTLSFGETKKLISREQKLISVLRETLAQREEVVELLKMLHKNIIRSITD